MLLRFSAGRTAPLGRRVVNGRRAFGIHPLNADSRDGEIGSTVCATNQPVHITIIGGGAAGLTAAFFAAEHGARVTVLERTREAGKKILMSGGSRCNVLPLEVDLATDFFSDSSDSAVRAVFASWNLEFCKAWLEDPYWGVGLDLSLEEETKKFFPTSNSSREVRDRLVAACVARGVSFKYNASVEDLRPLEPPPAPGDDSRVAGGRGSAHTHTHGHGHTHAGEGESRVEEKGVEWKCSGGATPGPLTQPIDDAAAGDAAGAVAVDSEEGAAATAGGGRRRVGKRGRVGAGEVEGGDAAAASTSATTTAAAATRWLCRLRDGSEHVSDKVILATGGLSFPAVGTDGTGHRLLAALGHQLRPTYPALTPLTGRHPAGEQLAGVSMSDVDLSVQLPATRRPQSANRTALLFTHRGFSGPAVLDLSHHAVKALEGAAARGKGAAGREAGVGAAAGGNQGNGRKSGQPVGSRTGTGEGAGTGPGAGQSGKANAHAGASGGVGQAAAGGGGGGSSYLARGLPALRVNWTNESAAVWDERIRAGGIAQVSTLLQRHGLRERLAEALTGELGLVGRRVCDVRKTERAALISALTAYELPYTGHEGYKKAEVTGGGVRLEELNCATMESRLLPSLFICGECVDIFGRIGGFNFYWAWVSGRLAGIGAAQGGLRPSNGKPRATTTNTSTTATTTNNALARSLRE